MSIGLIKGSVYKDERGTLTYNNDFDASAVKRIYTIENNSTEFTRGWQGHKIERRWFVCIKGSFKIAVIKLDDFEHPSKDLIPHYFILGSKSLDFLNVECGCVTAIRAIEKESRLLILSDYALGEIDDEYRYPIDYFKFEP